MTARPIAPTLAALLLAGCAQDAGEGAQAVQARQAMVQAGCGACHRIPGVPGADGLAGPSLQGEGRRIYIAGVLPNLPQTMVRWISDPQGVLPGNAMPDTGLRPQDAQAIAAYLERLK